MPTPIKLTLYDQATGEEKQTFNQSFVPWKLLKRAIAIKSAMSSKPSDQYTDADIDELAGLVVEVFGDRFSVQDLDDMADITEMVTVMQSIIARAKGVIDPTLPRAK